MAETATILLDETSARCALEHKKKIAENYRKLLFDNGEEWAAGESRMQSAHRAEPSSAPAFAATPAYTATLERAPVAMQAAAAPVQAPSAPQTAPYTADPARRIADYVACPSVKKGGLWEGLAIKDGELVDLNAPAVMPAPAPVEMPAAPAYVPSEEDAMPTPRTMETLRRGTETAAESEKQGLLSALSLKTKLILCAIAAAVVLIIALICVNTGILNASHAEIAVKEAQLRDLQTQYAQMQEDLEYLRSPERIDAWAEANGMVMGD